ncbi:MAG: hypothetical protein V3S11_06610, partial [Elusimicrobiota bacterium]
KIRTMGRSFWWLAASLALTITLFAACRWQYRYLPTDKPRPASDRLFENCDRRGLSHAACQNEMGCSPEMTRRECKRSLKRRLQMMSHD